MEQQAGGRTKAILSRNQSAMLPGARYCRLKIRRKKEGPSSQKSKKRAENAERRKAAAASCVDRKLELEGRRLVLLELMFKHLMKGMPRTTFKTEVPF